MRGKRGRRLINDEQAPRWDNRRNAERKQEFSVWRLRVEVCSVALERAGGGEDVEFGEGVFSGEFDGGIVPAGADFEGADDTEAELAFDAIGAANIELAALIGGEGICGNEADGPLVGVAGVDSDG